jgi:ABC-2 type transport system ATP-binding protein
VELRAQGVTVFFSSHVLSDVEQICDRVGIMAHGVLQAVGTIDELVADKQRAVEVTVEALDDALRARLEQQALEALPVRGDQLILTVPDTEAANALAREVLAAGGRLVSVVPRRESLEQLFMDEMNAIERQRREGKVR